MISTSGNFLLLLSMAFSFLAIVTKARIKFFSFTIGSLSPIMAFLLLIIGFIISDFSLKNVFFNSSNLQPLIYKIAASWASHEGSILLWVSLIGMVSLIYVYYFRLSSELNEYRIVILSFINILFCSFTYFTSNPFDKLSFIPTEGLGLNPVLQDVAISIHPPLLYLGYVSYIILFTNACLVLMYPTEKTDVLQISYKASSFALATLSCGIGLGSWWAYRELGWGGFWFFDPVENISLLPWLCGIALHHFLVVTIKEGKYLRFSVCFSILVFLLTLYGIFFVRSGIVSSVHSFAFSPERGMYILLICLVITILGIFLFIYKQGKLKNNSHTNLIQKTILTGNILWFFALITLLIGIVYPIYFSYFYKIDIAIDPEYYNTVFISLMIPLLILASLAPHLLEKHIRKNIIYFILSVLVTFFITKNTSFSIISASILFTSIYLIIQMIDFLFIKTNYFCYWPNINNIIVFLGHLGFGILALSITLNIIFSSNLEFIGGVNHQVNSDTLTVKLENIKFADGKNYFRQIAEFSVQDKYTNVVYLKPENRLYKVKNVISSEADIYSYLTHDLYAVLTKVDGKIIHAHLYYRPFISFIWFSIFLIFIPFILICFRKNNIFYIR